MKFVTPSVEIWEQDVTTPETLVEAMWAHIARCVRVCYQVDKSKNNETEEEYVRRVIFRNPDERLANHYSVLEHGAVYFSVEIPDDVKEECPIEYYDISNTLWGNPFTKRKKEDIKDTHIWHYSTNLRVLVENNLLWALKYAVPFNPEWHTPRITASFITNIGAIRDINRHRVHSISEESTRFCNYSNERFGEELTFLKPAWIDIEDINQASQHILSSGYNSGIKTFIRAMQYLENAYMMLIESGWKPEQARDVLPLNIKTQSIHTAFIDDWWDFLKLRHDEVSGPVQPNVKVIADMLSDKLHCMFSNNG